MGLQISQLYKKNPSCFDDMVQILDDLNIDYAINNKLVRGRLL